MLNTLLLKISIVSQFFLQFNTIIEKAILVTVLGIILLITHSFNFKFLINRSSIFLSLMLPITILIVTQTIATNLYLSLGLIGALSIVRYRTPVKSQYELAYLFVLIAIGIVGGVRPDLAVFLTIFISGLPIVYNLFIKFFPSIDRENLRTYSDGKVEMQLLCTIANANSNFVNSKINKVLRADYDYKKNEVFYLFSFNNLEDATSFQKKLNFKPISISISNS